jgi:hypothetical protein
MKPLQLSFLGAVQQGWAPMNHLVLNPKRSQKASGCDGINRYGARTATFPYQHKSRQRLSQDRIMPIVHAQVSDAVGNPTSYFFSAQGFFALA